MQKIEAERLSNLSTVTEIMNVSSGIFTLINDLLPP